MTSKILQRLLRGASLCGFFALGSCLSKEPVAEVHYFRPDLDALQPRAEAGSKALRLQPVSSPVELGARMLWRVSATELVPDDQNLWARRPDELLDERLGDLLFGGGGFRSSLRAGDPVLDVRLVTFEGDTRADALASLELILVLQTADALEHRTRIRVTEPLSATSAEGLADAMGTALSVAAARTEAWVVERLR